MPSLPDRYLHRGFEPSEVRGPNPEKDLILGKHLACGIERVAFDWRQAVSVLCDPLGAALHRLRLVEDLPEHDELGEGGNRAQEVPDEAVLEDRVVDGLEAEDHEPVLAHRVGGRHVHGRDARGGLPDRPARRRRAEERRDPLLRVHLADEHALAGAGRVERERGRHGGLPHAALPGHDQQPPVEKGRGGHEA